MPNILEPKFYARYKYPVLADVLIFIDSISYNRGSLRFSGKSIKYQVVNSSILDSFIQKDKVLITYKSIDDFVHSWEVISDEEATAEILMTERLS